LLIGCRTPNHAAPTACSFAGVSRSVAPDLRALWTSSMPCIDLKSAKVKVSAAAKGAHKSIQKARRYIPQLEGAAFGAYFSRTRNTYAAIPRIRKNQIACIGAS
jgi:hypothetical protein